MEDSSPEEKKQMKIEDAQYLLDNDMRSKDFWCVDIYDNFDTLQEILDVLYNSVTGNKYYAVYQQNQNGYRLNVHCEVCNKDLSAFDPFITHENGKPHKKSRQQLLTPQDPNLQGPLKLRLHNEKRGIFLPGSLEDEIDNCRDTVLGVHFLYKEVIDEVELFTCQLCQQDTNVTRIGASRMFLHLTSDAHNRKYYMIKFGLRTGMLTDLDTELRRIEEREGKIHHNILDFTRQLPITMPIKIEPDIPSPLSRALSHKRSRSRSRSRHSSQQSQQSRSSRSRSRSRHRSHRSRSSRSRSRSRHRSHRYHNSRSRSRSRHRSHRSRSSRSRSRSLHRSHRYRSSRSHSRSRHRSHRSRSLSPWKRSVRSKSSVKASSDSDSDCAIVKVSPPHKEPDIVTVSSPSLQPTPSPPSPPRVIEEVKPVMSDFGVTTNLTNEPRHILDDVRILQQNECQETLIEDQDMQGLLIQTLWVLNQKLDKYYKHTGDCFYNAEKNEVVKLTLCTAKLTNNISQLDVTTADN